MPLLKPDSKAQIQLSAYSSVLEVVAMDVHKQGRAIHQVYLKFLDAINILCKNWASFTKQEYKNVSNAFKAFDDAGFPDLSNLQISYTNFKEFSNKYDWNEDTKKMNKAILAGAAEISKWHNMILNKRKLSISMVAAIQAALSAAASDNSNGSGKLNDKVLSGFNNQASQEKKSSVEEIPQLPKSWNNVVSINSRPPAFNPAYEDESKDQDPPSYYASETEKYSPSSSLNNSPKRLDSGSNSENEHESPTLKSLDKNNSPSNLSPSHNKENFVLFPAHSLMNDGFLPPAYGSAEFNGAGSELKLINNEKWNNSTKTNSVLMNSLGVLSKSSKSSLLAELEQFKKAYLFHRDKFNTTCAEYSSIPQEWSKRTLLAEKSKLMNSAMDSFLKASDELRRFGVKLHTLYPEVPYLTPEEMFPKKPISASTNNFKATGTK